MSASDRRSVLLGLLMLAAAFGPPALLAEGEQSLAKQSQNPVGDVVSLPFENNVLFGIGPSDSSAYVLNVKPVYPVRLGKLNLINRFILPVIYAEGQDVTLTEDQTQLLGFGGEMRLANGSAFGVGDTTYQAFFSPAEPGKLIWGVGPAFVLPTATESRFASEKWSAGISAVALAMPGRWVVGMLVQNVWSVAGDGDADDVNQFLVQPFANYNLDGGWYLNTSPVITADWEADGADQWTVPLGMGIGRLVRHGNQPVDYRLAAYSNVEGPSFSSDWSLQFTVKFLFPK
jgi:hypothetical protein